VLLHCNIECCDETGKCSDAIVAINHLIPELVWVIISINRVVQITAMLMFLFHHPTLKLQQIQTIQMFPLLMLTIAMLIMAIELPKK